MKFCRKCWSQSQVAFRKHMTSFNLSFFLANFGPFLYGVSLGWSAPAGPQLVSEENDFPMTLTEFSLAVAAMPLGAAMFCVLSGLFRNRFGTRFTILSLALPNLLGWLALMFAWNTKMVCKKFKNPTKTQNFRF